MTVGPARVAVVPVAGLATRMQPLARSIPKEMLPLGDRPILHHVVDELVDGGVEHVVLIVGANAEPIRRYFDAVPELDARLRAKSRDPAHDPVWRKARQCRFTFVEQQQARGVADAVSRAHAIVGNEPYIVHMGDSVIPGETTLMLRMQDALREHNADMVVAVSSRLAHPSGAEAVADPDGPDTLIEQPYLVRRFLEHPPREGRALPFVIGRFLMRGPMHPWEGPAPEFGRVGGLTSLLPSAQAACVIAVPLEGDSRPLGGGTLEEYYESWRAWLGWPGER